MPKYQVFVDLSETWEEGDIEVISFHVEANHAEEAYDKACEEIDEGKHNETIGNRDLHVWEVTEHDKVEEL